VTPPRKILVLTASHLCKNPRVVKEAAALSAAGYEVTVMSVSSAERFERYDRDMMRTLPFRRITLDFTRTDRATRLRGLLSRGATWLARAMLRHTRIETPDALGPARPLLLMARAFPADLIIVHTEIPMWAAQQLIRDGRRVAVDIEDWYSEDLLYVDRRSRPLRLLRQAENFVLNHAAYSSATSESMADALMQAYHCPRPTVVRNSFPLPPTSRVDRPIGTAPPGFIWFSQTIGPGRGLELFAAAWNRMRHESRLFLLGDERPGYRDHILSRIAPERRSRVGFLPLVSPEDLPGRLAEFDLGLALEPHWPHNRDITITNKILQYMNAGLALIATDTAGQTEVMRAAPDSGLLVQAHETTQLAARLDDLVGQPSRLRACQIAARAAAAQEFCWEKEAPRLRAAVERGLAVPSPTRS
jgi:glycosyltransferase involved in cell wall biosynthesis